MENNAHTDNHDSHATEGDRQSYPKGWWIPKVGLLIIALGFTVLGSVIFSHAGTDRWGKTEQCEKNGKCCAGENANEANCKDGKEATGTKAK
jgi:hypothetical protein